LGAQDVDVAELGKLLSPDQSGPIERESDVSRFWRITRVVEVHASRIG
jgi:hypothetical protein